MAHAIIPYETLKKMHQCITVDQGNKYRENLGKVLPHIGDAYRSDEEPFRAHLGASIVGQECPRAIWYSWRWVTQQKFSGQMLRLFNRGHLEEGRFVALLLTMGCKVYQQDANGKQFRITHADGHMGGSGDGVVIGIPDVDKATPLLLECKTHNEKSFAKLAGSNWRKHLDYHLGLSKVQVPFDGDGVKEAKPEHAVQCQLYASKMGLSASLYMAVNKNTDDIYCEILPLDTNFAEQFLYRGEQLTLAQKPPKKLSESPGFWRCKFCEHRPVCHLNAAPEVNCRTCTFAHPVIGEPGGQWHCNHIQRRLTKEEQFKGCVDYTRNPDL